MDEERKIQIDIVLKRDELVQHVRDAAYVMARSASAKGERPSRDNSWLIDIFQSTRNGAGNEELATRAMSLAASYVDMKLSEHGDGIDVLGRECIDDDIERDGFFHLHFAVSEGTKRATIKHIKNLAHEMLVYFTLLRWSELIGESNVEYLQGLCATIDKNLTDAICNCQDAIIRPMFPIW